MGGRRVAALLAAVTMLGGCGGDEERDTAATATPAATAAPEPAATEAPAPPAAPRARRVTLVARDGERAAARFTPAGRRAPAVVLVHEIRGGPDQWDPLVPYLHEAGFATLAYKSRPSPMERERLPDLVAALDWLRAHPKAADADRIGIVGASIGASTTALAMATEARRVTDAAVALSPPASADIWALQDTDRWRPHDVLFIADRQERVSAEEMLDGAVRSEMLTSSVPGHGVVLLGEPEIRDAVVDWLRERVT